MSDILYVLLAIIGVLTAGFGFGGYIRSRKKDPPQVIIAPPSAAVIAPPVTETAPTPNEVTTLDTRADHTTEKVDKTKQKEHDLETTPHTPNRPDPAVVSMLRGK